MRRLSFVGNSIGNLIVRATLCTPQMRPLLGRLHTYVSISGPHLGCMYNDNSLVDGGMWLLRKVRRSRSLRQLGFGDKPRLRDCFLAKLARAPTGLGLFTNVLLVCSPQDRYVPYCSARVEPLAPWRPKHRRWREHAQMALSLFAPLMRRGARDGGVRARVDVIFDWPREGGFKTAINRAIGRAAHIEMVDNEAYVQLLLEHFPALFE